MENTIKNDEKFSKSKAAIVDTVGNITYSLVAGSLLDYCAGLNPTGIVASRASATVMNSVTGAPYGWWREKIFKKTNNNENSSKLRKGLVDLLAFNTFQVPVYATAIAIGSLISEGKVDWNKVAYGSAYLAAISPLIGPTLGLWMDGLRKITNVKSAAEGVYGKPK